MNEEVILEQRGPVAWITISREERRNAIDAAVIRGIAAALDQAVASDARAIVLTGAGDKAFCAGGDLGGMTEDSKIAQHDARGEVGALFARMRSAEVPIIARVNGHALGGGFGLMLACDVVVASSDAKVGTPEVDLGLWPFIITAVVQRDVPRKVALEMMLTGRKMPAEEAAHWGFVNMVAAPDALDEELDRLVGAITSKSPSIAALGKRSFYKAEDMTFEQSVEYLSGMLSLALGSEDAIEGVTAFLQKRRPEWKGR